MARFGIALALLLATTPAVDGYSNFTPVSRQLQRGVGQRGRQQQQLPYGASNHRSNLSHGTPRSVSATNADFGGPNGDSLSDALNSVTSAARASIAKAVTDEPDLDEAEIAKKKKTVQDRLKVYKVTLPLASTTLEEKSTLLSMGLKLRQVEKGRTLGPTELNLDTLTYETYTATEIKSKNSDGERVDEARFARRVDGEFQGVVVSCVDKDSAAWAAGVRPGDIVKSTSATIGNQMWPKSTLEGIQSALSSRKVSSGVVQFEFQRLGEVVDNQFELSITRPIGLELKETRDGYVEVAGFTSTAPTLVRYAVKVGDRVLAVDSSLGEKMWPVSTVEGVISAVTARLPGQQITFRFERPLENMDRRRVELSAQAVTEDTASATTSGSVAGVPEEVLLKRCREILKRYATDARKTDKFVNKYAVRGMVADKVLDALETAQVKVDRATLSMLMSAYLASGKPEKAISTFEAVVGLDSKLLGAVDDVDSSDDVAPSGLKKNIDALDIYTASSLLKAHAMKNDLLSVKRVWAAVVKDSSSVVAAATDATAAAKSLPEKLSTVVPDACFYNIAMAAAVDAASPKGDQLKGVEFALKIFESMEHPKATHGTAPRRDVISYNTAIDILTKRGRYEEALNLLDQMKRDGVRPDKFSYATLVEAVVSASDDDLEELLYDMREQGVVVDVVVYNLIIKSFCEQRRLAPAKRMVNEMEAAGLSPDSRSYGLLMKGLIDVGKPGAALTLFESACSDQKTVALTENHHLYTTAITAAAAVGDSQRALELLSRMNAIGVKPTVKTMTALMGACMSAGQANLAVDIYNRIPEPDGFAMAKGVRALSLSGDGEAALAMLRSAEENMSGKQIMSVQQNIIEAALRGGDYELARKAVLELLRRGHIPSTAIYQSMFDILQLFPSSRKDVQTLSVDEEEKEKFKFLLFVLDSTSNRNLPCDGPLYSAILSYAIRLGALPKKIAALLVSARNANDGIEGKNVIMDARQAGEKAVTSWEELYVMYDDLKGKIVGPEVLPRLTLRVGRRDLPKILRAENGLSFTTNNKIRR